MANICPSRRSTHQIMAHSGFGDVVMHVGKYAVTIPQSSKAINRYGRLSKRVLNRLHDINESSIKKLHDTYGVTVKQIS